MTLPQELAGLSQAFDGAEIDLYGRAELQAQYEANMAAQGKELPQAPVDALADIATKAVAEVVGANWEVATSTHTETTRLFSEMLPNLKVPELADFIEAGVDFEHLKQGFEAYQTAGMEPELILAPVNLSLADAKQLYSSLRQWQETKVPLPAEGQPDPLKGRRLRVLEGGDGLRIYTDVTANWDSLAQQATDDAPGAKVQSPDGTVWKVLAVPTADEAAGGLVVYTSHNLSKGKDNLSNQASLLGVDLADITPAQAHMPIASYLTLQAMRIRSDIQPIDDGGWTWNAGTFNSLGRLWAPAAIWYAGGGQVFVDRDGVGGVLGSLGARLPVWG